MTSIRHRVLAIALAGSTLFGASTLVDAPIADAQESSDAAERQADRRAKLEERLADAVADGRITQERADALLSRLDERIERFENRDGISEADRDDRRAEREARRAERREARGAQAAALAEVLGTTPDEMVAALRGGASLADIAAANGVDVSAVVAHLLDAASERIDAAVDAGRIDAARADEFRAMLEDRITERVENGRPERGADRNGERPGRGNGVRPDRGERGGD